ncbi:MAG: PD-(D/E)XK nuclease family protein, partial [Clostridia bacterium]|nr:PD-(D/E)XK nuclease family protein [Clostridia bacterium]
MLRLVKGRAGSGKTKYVTDEFITRVKNGGDGLVLIVPDQFTFECERLFLRSLSAAQARRIEVLSFSRIADRLMDEHGYSRKFIDRGKQAVAMSVALESISDELEVYKSRSGRFDFVESLLRLMSELKYNCATPQALLDARSGVSSDMLKKKLGEISLISQAYSTVVSQMFFDYDDKLDILHELVLESGFFKGKTVAIDSFESFTEQAMRVIELITKQADDVFVTVCTDSASPKDDFSLFSCGNRMERELLNMANRASVARANPIVLDSTPRFTNDELRVLEQNVFALTRDSYDGECKNIEICAAKDIYDECNWVARKIKNLLRNDAMRARDIAVIYRNESYARILPPMLSRHGIPVFEDNRQPFSTQPLLVFVKHLFSAVRSGYKSEELFKYLKSGLAGITTEQISELENYVYVWQISGSAWDSEWKGNPRGFEEMQSYDEDKLKKINELRERVIAPLKNFRYKCKNSTALGISTAIFELFREIDVKKGLLGLALSLDERGERELALQQDLAWKFVMRALDDMVNMLGERGITLEAYERLFDFLVSSSDFGIIPSGLDEVAIGSANRIKPMNPRVVFVVGLNEGEFPKTQSTGGAFTDFERKELSTLGEKLVDNGEHKLSQERFYTYAALCCARERVFASYSRMSMGGEQLAPSVAISQIKSIFKKLTVTTTAEKDELDYAFSRDSAFEILAGRWTEDSAFIRALKNYFVGIEKYRPIMQALDNITQKRDFAIGDTDVARQLFGEDMYVSPSKAEEFHKCHFRYFCQHGMRISRRSVAGLDPMKSGILVHHVMECLLKKYNRDALCSTDFKVIKADIEVFMNDYLETEMGGREGKSGRFMYLFDRLKIIVYSVVSRTIEEFSRSEFDFAAFELRIDRDGAIAPLKLVLPAGGSVNVRGSVDRVDTYQRDGITYIKVVDYKTGSKKFSLSDVLNGLNMQMLIYLDCI